MRTPGQVDPRGNTWLCWTSGPSPPCLVVRSWSGPRPKAQSSLPGGPGQNACVTLSGELHWVISKEGLVCSCPPGLGQSQSQHFLLPLLWDPPWLHSREFSTAKDASLEGTPCVQIRSEQEKERTNALDPQAPRYFHFPFLRGFHRSREGLRWDRKGPVSVLPMLASSKECRNFPAGLVQAQPNVKAGPGQGRRVPAPRSPASGSPNPFLPPFLVFCDCLSLPALSWHWPAVHVYCPLGYTCISK